MLGGASAGARSRTLTIALLAKAPDGKTSAARPSFVATMPPVESINCSTAVPGSSGLGLTGGKSTFGTVGVGAGVLVPAGVGVEVGDVADAVQLEVAVAVSGGAAGAVGVAVGNGTVAATGAVAEAVTVATAVGELTGTICASAYCDARSSSGNVQEVTVSAASETPVTNASLRAARRSLLAQVSDWGGTRQSLCLARRSLRVITGTFRSGASHRDRPYRSWAPRSESAWQSLRACSSASRSKSASVSAYSSPSTLA